MEALVGQGQPTGDLPSDVLTKLRGRLPVRQPLQRLQHHDRGHLIGRDRRPTPTRREQVGEQLVREQILAMVGQKGIYRALGDQVAAQRRRVQQLDTSGISCP
jgi:ATP-dependent protease HslVU (ClpYQ) ATPase subunit